MFGTAGIIALAVGLLILIWPGKSAVAVLATIAAMVGIWSIINGVIYIGLAIFNRDHGGWGRIGYGALGLLFIVGGIIMLGNLFLSALTVTVLITVTVGVLWIIEGVVAFVMLAESPHKFLTAVHGILAVLAGVALLISPVFGAFVLWWFIGVSLVALGVVQLIRAITYPKADPTASPTHTPEGQTVTPEASAEDASTIR